MTDEQEASKWDVERLYELLVATTQQFRKSEAVTREVRDGLDVTEIYDMPHEADADGLQVVDCHFITVGVKQGEAEQIKAELLELLRQYPQPERLAGGPSYIELGAILGDQGAAFSLFALGSVLGLWEVITPKTMGMEGPEADQMAGAGFVMISGFKDSGQPAAPAAPAARPS